MFPSDYKTFLVKYGGSSFDTNAYYKPKVKSHWTPEDGYDSIDEFYGFAGENSISKMLKRYFGRMPDALVPIADDGGGNQICICCKGESEGKIYFWDHENELEANKMLKPHIFKEVNVNEYWENIYLVDDSFADFIMGFEIREEEKAKDSSVTMTFADGFLEKWQKAREELEKKEKKK
jgi:hypothetical protein